MNLNSTESGTNNAAAPLTLAGLEQLAEVQSSKRRFKEFPIPLLGTVRLGSVGADEYAAIDTLITRASVALRNRKPDVYQALNAEAFFQLLLLIWVDEKNQPVLQDNERCRQLVKKLDNSVSEALQDVALKWAGVGAHADAELEAAAKK